MPSWLRLLLLHLGVQPHPLLPLPMPNPLRMPPLLARALKTALQSLPTRRKPPPHLDLPKTRLVPKV